MRARKFASGDAKGEPFCAGDRRGFASSPFAHAVGTAKINFEIKRKNLCKRTMQIKKLIKKHY
jgi:hypothetical protein